LHTNPQVPPPHATDAFDSTGHGLEHAPQFSGSVLVFVHVPAPLPHGVSVAGHEHVPVHTPPVAHTVPGVPASPAPHAPLAPQCCVLLPGSMHSPPQLISVPGHVSEQLPVLQICPNA
jgi:hypothetical protein